MKEKQIVIDAHTKWFDFRLRELWQYRDLIFLFVKRNYSTRYKQMILGPAWLIISPMFTVFAYTIVFGGIAKLPTDDIPAPLFYLAGNIFWSFFSDSVTGTASTFTSNAGIFGKVYFPRLATPIANILTSGLDFLVRFGLLLLLLLYFFWKGYPVVMNGTLLFIPLLLLQVALLGLGVGVIVSSATTKYRDLQVLVDFGMKIWLYVTPVIYTMSTVPEQYRFLIQLNPITASTLMFKDVIFTGDIHFTFYWWMSWGITIVCLLCGILLFHHVERTFMDTV